VMLTEGDRNIIMAALQSQAMLYGEQSKRDQAAGRLDHARRNAAFSMECARLADMFRKI
jgi:hypothetical protein